MPIDKLEIRTVSLTHFSNPEEPKILPNAHIKDWAAPDPADEAFIQTLVDGGLSKSWRLVSEYITSL